MQLKQIAAPSCNLQAQATISPSGSTQQPQTSNQGETALGLQSIELSGHVPDQLIKLWQYNPTSANQPTSISNCIKQMRKEHTRLRLCMVLKVAEAPSNEVFIMVN